MTLFSSLEIIILNIMRELCTGTGAGSNVVVSLILGRQAGRLASPTLVICPCVDGVDYFTFRCLVVLAGWLGGEAVSGSQQSRLAPITGCRLAPGSLARLS